MSRKIAVNVNVMLKRAAAAAGLPAGFSAHWLRHAQQLEHLQREYCR
jgi:hypothetical protein